MEGIRRCGQVAWSVIVDGTLLWAVEQVVAAGGAVGCEPHGKRQWLTGLVTM